jgi:hypothetical protein
MKNLRQRRTSNRTHRVHFIASAAAAALAALGQTAQAAGAGAFYASGSALLSAPCLDNTVPLVSPTGVVPPAFEETRLGNTLPVNGSPAVLQTQSFPRQVIEGADFQDFGPALVDSLCRVRNFDDAYALLSVQATQLWRNAVNRAQQHGPVKGILPYSDDRPLYWTRLQVRAAVRQWQPGFALSDDQRYALIENFDRTSRGMHDVNFPVGKGVKRLIFSGFDPYTLDGGVTGTATGAVGNNIRHDNPSGATALHLDGTTYHAKDGTVVFIESYTLPVNYPEFFHGYQEDTIGPFFLPGPRRVNAAVSVSQAGPYEFDLEQWNGRYHGQSVGNDDFASCPRVNRIPQIAINNHECNIQVVERWGGPATFDLTNPPQFTTTSLPIAAMIAANTGATVTRPPGDGWGLTNSPAGALGDTSVAFGVVWHTPFTEFPDCTQTTAENVNTPVAIYPPPTPPTPPTAGSCSEDGGGGNYLSNESAYRNTLLRDRMGLTIPAGHIHTPDSNTPHDRDPVNVFNLTDPNFDQWRVSTVEQATNLIHVVADEAPQSDDNTQ